MGLVFFVILWTAVFGIWGYDFRDAIFGALVVASVYTVLEFFGGPQLMQAYSGSRLDLWVQSRFRRMLSKRK